MSVPSLPANEVGISLVQGFHELGQALLELSGHRLVGNSAPCFRDMGGQVVGSVSTRAGLWAKVALDTHRQAFLVNGPC